MNAEHLTVFIMIYDLHDEDVCRKVHRDRSLWGKLYTEVGVREDEHVILTFRPAPDSCWRRWEEVRRAWILGEVVAA